MRAGRSAAICLVLPLLAGPAHAANNPHHSINPERTLPTPYGLKIMRSSEVRAVPVNNQPRTIGLNVGYRF